MKKLLLALALLAFGLGPALAQDSPSDQDAGGGNDPPKQTGGGGSCTEGSAKAEERGHGMRVMSTSPEDAHHAPKQG
jgi:hypothetical protein